MVLEQTDILNVARQIFIDKRKVRIIGTTELQITPFYITPAKSQELRDYEYGSEINNLESSELTWMKKVFTESKKMFTDKDEDDNTESIPVSHLEIFDCSRQRDAAIFLVLATTGQLANNKGDVNPDYHMFYIEDKEAEAQTFTSSLDKKRKCWDYIDNQIPVEDLAAYFKLIKMNDPSNLSRTVMLSALQEEADKRPVDVYKIISDEKLPFKLLIQKLIIEGTIGYNSHEKVYKSGELVIGSTLGEAVDFLLKDENAALKDQWASRVTKKSKLKK